MTNHPPQHQHSQRHRPDLPSEQPKSNSRRDQSTSHGKDSEAQTVENAYQAPPPSTTSTTTTSTTSTTTTTTTESTTDATDTASAKPYPLRPSTLRASTTYSLFSSPDAFSPSAVRARTHYLTDALRGTIWWDVDGDGKRGSWSNSTLNDMEYDHGVGNVGNIHLVSCDGGGRSGSAASSPYNGRDAAPLPRSLDATAGTYEFGSLPSVPSGRYYVMYESPRNWRSSANVLPLGRTKGEGGSECVPSGGEGGEFGEEARATGDLDYGGYCSRSIGCLEIGTREELEEKFADLKALEETEYWADAIRGDAGGTAGYGTQYGGKMVALPSEYFLDVGMTREEWDLNARQFAEATIDLAFPAAEGRRTRGGESLEALLGGAFADPASFGRSDNRKVVGKMIEEYLRENIGNLAAGGNPREGGAGEPVFDLAGVDLYEGKIERRKKDGGGEKVHLIKRYLRASRRVQDEEAASGGGEEQVIVTYSFTARGSYNPPPHDQLGYFVQNSINAEPDKLVRTLREDPELPFQDLEQATSTHLTVGPPAPKVCAGCAGIQSIQSGDTGGMADWATVPLALLSVAIGALAFVFLTRRIWKRRRLVDPDAEMRTKDFAVSNLDMDKEKELMELIPEEDVSHSSEEKKKRRKKKKHAENDETFVENSHRLCAADANSEGSNPNTPAAEGDDSGSSSDSSEDSEARRRRRRHERKAKKAPSRRESRDTSHDKPPTLEDLNRSSGRKKKKGGPKRMDRSVD